jgi:hypothetical protein
LEILFSSRPTSSNALQWHAIRLEAHEGLVQVQTVAPRSIKAQLSYHPAMSPPRREVNIELIEPDVFHNKSWISSALCSIKKADASIE